MCLYLTRLRLATGDPEAARTLAQPYRLHQAVYAGFDPAARGDQRVLYRLEPELRAGHATVVVQSPLPPDWRRHDGGLLGRAPAVDQRAFDPADWALAPGACLRFRLRANPTAKLRRDPARDTQRHALYAEDQQRAWLTRKLLAAGAEALDTLVVDEGLLVDGPRTWLSVRFDGHLRVRDPDLLRVAVAAGIGSAKGFGFGLLSLARA